MVEYQIVLENIGSVDSGEVAIIEQLPLELISASWQCDAYDGAACLNIDEFGITGGADIPSGSRVELLLRATVDPALINADGTLIINTIDVQMITETDFNLLNNTASDTDEIVLYIFKNGFE